MARSHGARDEIVPVNVLKPVPGGLVGCAGQTVGGEEPMGGRLPAVNELVQRGIRLSRSQLRSQRARRPRIGAASTSSESITSSLFFCGRDEGEKACAQGVPFEGLRRRRRQAGSHHERKGDDPILSFLCESLRARTDKPPAVAEALFVLDTPANTATCYQAVHTLSNVVQMWTVAYPRNGRQLSAARITIAAVMGVA